MVEVFKTNVTDTAQSKKVLSEIRLQFPTCMANFDLDDCDRILRLESVSTVCQQQVIELLRQLGHSAEALPD